VKAALPLKMQKKRLRYRMRGQGQGYLKNGTSGTSCEIVSDKNGIVT
jgi:hypothetical protein